MKLFLLYIKQRRRGIAAGVIFSLLFVVSFSLYQLPLKAVLYPVLLCLLIGVLFLIIDFLRVRHKHELLCSIRSLTDVATEALPRADGIEDEDYQNILSHLCSEYQDYITDSHLKYSEMVDYYTVWAHQIKTPIASMKLTLQNEDSALSRKLSNDLFRVEQYVEMVLTF